MRRSARTCSTCSHRSSELSLDDYDESDSEFEDVDSDNVDAELSFEKVIEKIAEGSDEERDIGEQIIAGIYGDDVASDNSDELLASDDESSSESSSEEELQFVKGTGRAVKHVRQLAQNSPSEYPTVSQPSTNPDKSAVEPSPARRIRPLTASGRIVARPTTRSKSPIKSLEHLEPSRSHGSQANRTDRTDRTDKTTVVQSSQPTTATTVKIPSRVSIHRPSTTIVSRYTPVPPPLPNQELSSTSVSRTTSVDNSRVGLALPPNTQSVVRLPDGVKLPIDKLTNSRGPAGYKKNELTAFARQLGVSYKSSDNKSALVDKILAVLQQ